MLLAHFIGPVNLGVLLHGGYIPTVAHLLFFVRLLLVSFMRSTDVHLIRFNSHSCTMIVIRSPTAADFELFLSSNCLVNIVFAVFLTFKPMQLVRAKTLV